MYSGYRSGRQNPFQTIFLVAAAPVEMWARRGAACPSFPQAGPRVVLALGGLARSVNVDDARDLLRAVHKHDLELASVGRRVRPMGRHTGPTLCRHRTAVVGAYDGAAAIGSRAQFGRRGRRGRWRNCWPFRAMAVAKTAIRWRRSSSIFGGRARESAACRDGGGRLGRGSERGAATRLAGKPAWAEPAGQSGDGEQRCVQRGARRVRRQSGAVRRRGRHE